MEIGDIVSRNSYNNDVMFRITDIIEDEIYVLSGLNYRLKIYTDRYDLQAVKLKKVLDFRKIFRGDLNIRLDKIFEERNNLEKFNKYEIKPGKVLHLDADINYLELCMNYYKILGIPAVGENILEEEQAEKIISVLKKHMPDILVITGHDSLSDKGHKFNLDNYKSSAYFIDTVKSARIFNPSKDSLIIIAGACQSHYEGLIEAGANIASSPERILIHAMDPVFVVEKVAYTPLGEILDIFDLLENTITGEKGLGGYQVRGTLRIGKRKIGNN